MRATDSTRGRFLTRLLRGPRTVAELADEFEMSTSAARQHLTRLERDGNVERSGFKHTITRPAALFHITADGANLFPSACAPVLQALMDEIETDYGEFAAGTLQNVGASLARSRQKRRIPADASTEERIDIGLALLAELGWAIEVKRFSNGAVRVDGACCPLSGALTRHPELCGTISAMLEEITFLPVEVLCRRDGEYPICGFLIGAPTEAPTEAPR